MPGDSLKSHSAFRYPVRAESAEMVSVHSAGTSASFSQQPGFIVADLLFLTLVLLQAGTQQVRKYVGLAQHRPLSSVFRGSKGAFFLYSSSWPKLPLLSLVWNTHRSIADRLHIPKQSRVLAILSAHSLQMSESRGEVLGRACSLGSRLCFI